MRLMQQLVAVLLTGLLLMQSMPSPLKALIQAHLVFYSLLSYLTIATHAGLLI